MYNIHYIMVIMYSPDMAEMTWFKETASEVIFLVY